MLMFDAERLAIARALKKLPTGQLSDDLCLLSLKLSMTPMVLNNRARTISSNRATATSVQSL